MNVFSHVGQWCRTLRRSLARDRAAEFIETPESVAIKRPAAVDAVKDLGAEIVSEVLVGTSLDRICAHLVNLMALHREGGLSRHLLCFGL